MKPQYSHVNNTGTLVTAKAEGNPLIEFSRPELQRFWRSKLKNLSPIPAFDLTQKFKMNFRVFMPFSAKNFPWHAFFQSSLLMHSKTKSKQVLCFVYFWLGAYLYISRSNAFGSNWNVMKGKTSEFPRNVSHSK